MFVHGKWQKGEFFGEALQTRKFSTLNFLGPVPTQSSCTQDSENIVGLGDRASVSKLLFVIDIDNIRLLEPFLSLYNHFEIWRFLGPNWHYLLKPCHIQKDRSSLNRIFVKDTSDGWTGLGWIY